MKRGVFKTQLVKGATPKPWNRILLNYAYMTHGHFQNLIDARWPKFRKPSFDDVVVFKSIDVNETLRLLNIEQKKMNKLLS